MFEIAIPVLHVRSAVAAEEFYCRRLGFTCMASWPPARVRDDPRYLTLVRDGARLHVHSFQGAGAGAGAVYFFIDNVDALHAELTSRSVPVSGVPLDQEWGVREITLRDPDGNVLTFGQRR